MEDFSALQHSYGDTPNAKDNASANLIELSRSVKLSSNTLHRSRPCLGGAIRRPVSMKLSKEKP